MEPLCIMYASVRKNIAMAYGCVNQTNTNQKLNEIAWKWVIHIHLWINNKRLVKQLKTDYNVFVSS